MGFRGLSPPRFLRPRGKQMVAVGRARAKRAKRGGRGHAGLKSSGRSQRKERGSGYGGRRGCSLESHVTDWRKCVDDYLERACQHARGRRGTRRRRQPRNLSENAALPPSLLSSFLPASPPSSVIQELREPSLRISPPSLARRPTAAATAAAHSHLCMLYRFSASDY